MPEEPKEEDDWTAYATAGFGQTDYSLWDDVNVEETESTDQEADFDEGDDLDDEMWEEPEQLGTHTEEVPRAPTSITKNVAIRGEILAAFVSSREADCIARGACAWLCTI